MPSRGIYLVATGNKNRHREALACALHLRAVGFTERIWIMTNELRWGKLKDRVENCGMIHADFEDVQRPDTGEDESGDYEASRQFRTQFHKFVADDVCLAIDTDLAAIRDPRGIWDQLGDGALGMCRDRFATLDEALERSRKFLGKLEEWNYMRAEGYLGKDVPVYNGGLMLFDVRKPATEMIFTAWRREWERFRQRDQQAMARALHDGEFPEGSFTEIPTEWNTYVFNMYYFRIKPPRNADRIVFVHCHIAAKEVYKEQWKAAKDPIKEAFK